LFLCTFIFVGVGEGRRERDIGARRVCDVYCPTIASTGECAHTASCLLTLHSIYRNTAILPLISPLGQGMLRWHGSFVEEVEEEDAFLG
jgi:hypothetical protein